ncbi:hypothetical protein BC938DRAFT_483773 [Jimgerdemannia flammicorona]|uniref:Uncharacterized protein n=1 Tax=Jimgerdemannia flammicorona TaxID=994334 RepID=A0A433QBA0_9FUNG|nr:hypothetical protein BC938DRAFT_483773 [Jimgerdemannia flammicorona]
MLYRKVTEQLRKCNEKGPSVWLVPVKGSKQLLDPAGGFARIRNTITRVHNLASTYFCVLVLVAAHPLFFLAWARAPFLSLLQFRNLKLEPHPLVGISSILFISERRRCSSPGKAGKTSRTQVRVPCFDARGPTNTAKAHEHRQGYGRNFRREK